jgi:hypothetical protein
MKKLFFSILALLLTVPAFSAPASDDFEIREMAVFHKGKKVEGSSVASARSAVNEKTGQVLLWAAVEAGNIPDFKGAATGLYFFWGTEELDGDGNMKNAAGQFAAFMPLENPEQAFLEFSADGRYFYTSQGTSPFRDLSVHEFGGFKKLQQFKSMPEVIWSPDWDGRLVFTLIDEAKGERSPDWGLMAPGWMSVVVYDPKADIVAPVAKATETADYLFEEIDYDTKRIKVTEFAVKNRADWAIVNAPEDKQRTMKFPSFIHR